MKWISQRSKILEKEIDGKTCSGDQLQNGKLTAKYTIDRSKVDIEKLEKAQKEEFEKDEKVSFILENKIYFGNNNSSIEKIPFETTRRGFEEFKRMMDPLKEEKELERAEEIGTLTFYDGVVLVREIFHRIIDGYFDDDDKDRFGNEYALGLYDQMEDILDNNVLNHMRDQRAEYLHDLFIMKSDLYELPLWMRKQKDEELKK